MTVIMILGQFHRLVPLLHLLNVFMMTNASGAVLTNPFWCNMISSGSQTTPDPDQEGGSRQAGSSMMRGRCRGDVQLLLYSTIAVGYMYI